MSYRQGFQILVTGECHNTDIHKDGKCPCLKIAAGELSLDDVLENLTLNGRVKDSEAVDISKLQKVAEIEPSAIQVLVTSDYCQYDDEHLLMFYDFMRGTSTYVSSLKDASQDYSKQQTIPPIAMRRCCPSLLSSDTIREELKQYEVVKDSYDKQKPISLVGGDISALADALNLCRRQANNDVRMHNIHRHMPYIYEHVITECKSGGREISLQGETFTVLEGVAAAIAFAQESNLKLIGSTMDYQYGTNIVLDDDQQLWPDDRTMSRVVVKIGDPWNKSDYLGREVKNRVERALRSLLICASPKKLDYDGVRAGNEVGKSAAYIDSLADVVSTLYNALERANGDEIEGLQDEECFTMKVISTLCGYDDNRIGGIFRVIKKAINYHVDGDSFEAQNLLRVTHILASAQDIERFRSPHFKFLKRLMAHNRVIWKLHCEGYTFPDIENLPYRGNMAQDYLEKVIELVNEAMKSKIECFKPCGGTTHASFGMPGTPFVDNDITFSCYGNELTVEPSQPTFLTPVGRRGTVAKVETGNGKGTAYKIAMKRGMLRVKKSTTAPLQDVQSRTEKRLSYESEAMNACLSGLCGLGLSRWALSSIYDGGIKISDRSTVSYIPKKFLFADESLPEIHSPLNRDLFQQMCILVPNNKRVLWVCFSENEEPMKISFEGECVRLSEGDGKLAIGSSARFMKGRLDRPLSVK